MKIPTNSLPSETTLLLSTKVLSFLYKNTLYKNIEAQIG